MQLHYRPLRPADVPKLRYLMDRAASKDRLRGSTSGSFLGPEYRLVYNTVVDMVKGDRNSGEPAIVHSVRISLGMLGYGHCYGALKINGDGRPEQAEVEAAGQLIVTPYDVLAYKKARGVENIDLIGACAGLVHDAVEDSSKTAEQIERNKLRLLDALQPIGYDFAVMLMRYSELLTNKYDIILKEAERLMPSDKSPLENVEAGLLYLKTLFMKTDTTKPYAAVLDALLIDLHRLRSMERSDDANERKLFRLHSRSKKDLMIYLKFRAYDRFLTDMVIEASNLLLRKDPLFDIHLLTKRQDAVDNAGTLPVDNIPTARRMLAKAEIVGRHLNNNDGYPASSGLVQILRHNVDTLGYVDDKYVYLIAKLAEQLRYLMIRACSTRLTHAAECIEEPSAATRTERELGKLKAKYKGLYDVGNGHEVTLVSSNVLTPLWRGKDLEVKRTEVRDPGNIEIRRDPALDDTSLGMVIFRNDGSAVEDVFTALREALEDRKFETPNADGALGTTMFADCFRVKRGKGVRVTNYGIVGLSKYGRPKLFLRPNTTGSRDMLLGVLSEILDKRLDLAAIEELEPERLTPQVRHA